MTEHAATRLGPLSHLTVLDLTQHLSGPFATQILGDLGARVIKVEPPSGDPTRRIGPYFEDGDSDYYHSVNRNKESVVIDLKAPGGRDTLLALAANADVLVENFRPDTLKRLGIERELLLEANPRMVLCSITGFGQDGPYRLLPAFDIIVQGISGGMSLTGEPEGKPVRSGLPIGDVTAGMYGVIGILAGLSEVARTGVGTVVDVAMLDTQVSLLSYVAAYYLASGAVPGRQGRDHMSIPTYRAFECKDGREVVVAANTEAFWPGLARALGCPALVHDDRFLDNDLRRTHRTELASIMESAAAQMEAAEFIERLRVEGVPGAPINSVSEALVDPQVTARNMVIDLVGRGDSIRTVGNPVKMPGLRSKAVAPPHLGADTEAVLSELAQLSSREIAELAAVGVIPTQESGTESLPYA
ncbi:CaiB/BaiF CoA transferase family protein [Microbacterium sp. I2]|uniref:CaiB/BaiF CoA transferase family protein n=1 Tax=Microbacterium sp. I2 TaxID=3391826 RepID=UPI003ED87F74